MAQNKKNFEYKPKIRFFTALFFAATLFLFSQKTVAAATYTWTGATSADWSTAANWLVGGSVPTTAPTVTDDVTIPITSTNPVLTASTSAATVTIESGAVLTFNAFTLTLTGAFTNNGRFILVTGDKLEAASVNSSGSLTFSGGTIETTGAQTYSGPVTVTVSPIFSSTGGAITFGSLNGSGSPTVTAGTGTITFTGDVGTSTALSALTTEVTSGTIHINANITTTGPQAYKGPVTIGGTGVTLTTTNNNVLFSNPLTLDRDLTITTGAGAGNITFASTVNGAQTLALTAGTGSIAFNDAVGGTTAATALASLSTGTTTGIIHINGGGVNTTGPQAYTAPVTIGAAGATLTTSNASITFTGAVTANQSLTLNSGSGAITFTSTFNQQATANFTITSGAVAVGANAFHAGNMVLNGGTFTQTDDNSGGAWPPAWPPNQSAQSITVNAGATMTWDSGSTGGYLLVSAAPSGIITYNLKNVYVGTAATNTLQHKTEFLDLFIPSSYSFTPSANFTVRRHVLIQAGGTYTHANQTMTLGGTNSMTGDISDNNTQNLGTVVINQDTTSKTFTTAITANSITADSGSDAIAFNGGLTAATLTNTGGSFALSFNDSSGGAQTTTITNAVTLNTTGTVSFGNAANDSATFNGGLNFGATPPASIALGGTLTIGSGGISFPSTVSLGAATTINTSNQPITFNEVVNGSNNLTVNSGNSNITFSKTVNSGILNLDAGTGTIAINGGSVTTSGGQQYQSKVTYDNTTTLTNNSFGQITFSNTLNPVGSNTNLTLSAIGVAFNHTAALNTTQINTLTINSSSTVSQNANCVINAQNLRLSGNGPFSLTAANAVTTLAAGTGTGTGAISFIAANNLEIGTVSGTNGITRTGTGSITISAGANTLTLSQPISSVNGNIQLTATGGISLGANTTTTGTGNITFSSPVKLAVASVAVSSNTGTILFSGTIDATAAGQSLAVTSNGTTTFSGAVGSATNPVSTLTKNGAGATQINGGAVTTTGTQTYNSQVASTGAIILTSTGGIIALNGGGVNTTGAQTYSGAVTINTNAATLTTSNDSITFEKAVTLNHPLALNTVTGAVTFTETLDGTSNLTFTSAGAVAFTGAVGGLTPIGSLIFTSVNTATFTSTFNQQATASFTITSGAVAAGANVFHAGNMVLNGGSFTQTGDNSGGWTAASGPNNWPPNQSATSITVNAGATMTWDGGSNGGYLLVANTLTSTGTFNTNLKNVYVGTAATNTLQHKTEFLDLFIPSSCSFTPSADFTVRRHVLIDGTYSDAAKVMTLGGANSMTGVISDNNTQNLGTVVINQNTTSKTFTTAITANSITADSGSGAIAFNGGLTAATLTNTGGSFALSFNGSGGEQTTTITNAVTLNTDGTISFGNAENDICNFIGGLSVANTNDTAKIFGHINTTNTDISFSKTIAIDGAATFSTDTAAGNITFAAAANGSGPLTLSAGTGTIAINGGSVTTTENQTYNSPVTLGSNTAFTLNGTGNITFNTNATITGTGTLAIHITGTGTGDVINLNGGVVTTNGTQTYGSPIVSAGSITLTSSGIALNGGSVVTTGMQKYVGPVTANKSLTITNGGYLDLSAGLALSDGSFTQNGAGSVQFAGTISTATNASASFAQEVFIYGTAELNTGTQTVNFAKNVFISATSFTLDSPLKTNENFALFNGAVTLGTNCTGITAEKDLVLLNGTSSVMFTSGGLSGLLGYNASNMGAYATARGTHTAAVNLTAFPPARPDGTSINHASGTYAGSITGLAGKTLSAGGNFYANGVNLTAASPWTLLIPDNADALASFAEAHNLTAQNSIVQVNTAVSPAGTWAWVAAAENCTDGGGNAIQNSGGKEVAGWAFSRPQILDNNNSLATGAPLSGTYTIYDDVIRVEFTDSISGKPAYIENNNNEISAALEQITFDAGVATKFSAAFTNPECTTSTNGAGDLSVFYLKTNGSPAQRWNTDATGSSAGAADSTDRGRPDLAAAHRTVKPSIDIPKALSAIFQTLRDERKNRIDTVLYTATADRCRPVVVEVRTGQESHTDIAAGVTQKEFDSHNFIEIRYSEPVNFGSLPQNALNEKVSPDFSAASGKWGGVITELAANGLEVAGYLKTAQGRLKTGSRTAADTATSASINPSDNTIHALYREFSESGGAGTVQTHRVRISIAGYVSNTVTLPNGQTVFFWPGFIDESQNPSGAVTIPANNFIRDRSAAVLNTAYPELGFTAGAVGSELEPTNDGEAALNGGYGTDRDSHHPKAAISVNAAAQTGTLYGLWDSSAPIFAPYNTTLTGWNTDDSCEILGVDTNGSSYADSFEFHFFDNTPKFTLADPLFGDNRWVAKYGWVPAAGNGQPIDPYTNPAFAAQDITGGSRPFETTAQKTDGGIRASSLYGSLSAFTYGVQNEDSTSIYNRFDTSGFLQQVDTTTFFGALNIRATDSLYLQLKLPAAESNLFNPRQTFSIKYTTTNGFVTDLAGNRMKAAEVLSIDRTPPKFSMSVQPMGMQKLFILFNKQLRVEPADRQAIPSQLEIVDKITKAEIPNIIDTSIPAQVEFDKPDATGLILTLRSGVTFTLDEILKYAIRVKEGIIAPDPVTGQMVKQPLIFDTKNNAMVSGAMHHLSDFAVNAATPIFAASIPEKTNGTEGPKFDTARIFTGGEKLPDENNTHFEINIYNNTVAETGATGSLTLFASINPNSGSVSETYNTNTGENLKVWLPDPMPVLSPAANDNAEFVNEDTPRPSNTLRQFTMPNASEYKWKAGSTVEFLFQYTNPDHTYDPSKEDYDQPLEKIYCLRLSNPGDPTSLDLWRYDLFAMQRQRGGTSIFNNVINTNSAEEAVLEVVMPQTGSLSVTIMTIDGNVVKVLQRGRKEAGTWYFRWDGTNGNGRPVARGMYFVRISGTGIDETRKIMVVRD